MTTRTDASPLIAQSAQASSISQDEHAFSETMQNALIVTRREVRDSFFESARAEKVKGGQAHAGFLLARLRRATLGIRC